MNIRNVSIQFVDKSVSDVMVRFELRENNLDVHGTLMLSSEEYEANKEVENLEKLVGEHLKGLNAE